MQYVNRKEGCCMQYLNQEGWGKWFQHSSGSDNASGRRSGALNCFQIYLSVSPSVCRSVGRSDRLAASVSFLLVLPPSQRILFSTPQMFAAICCAALSCVYNKEVLVWRRREGSEVEEWVLLRRGGGHCAVGVNTGWCQLSLWPLTSQCSMLFLASPPDFPFYFPEGQMHLHVGWKSLRGG